MGQIISSLSSGKEVEIVLDFENAKPTSEEEKQIFNEVTAVLGSAKGILDTISGYKGCEDFIRKAIIDPKPENEDAAWQVILPAVDILKSFHDFSLELANVFPKLLGALCRNNPKAQLAGQQSLVKQLADVFDFVLRFDDMKMSSPSIQNDFSYYRRSLNRMKLAKKDVNISIRDDLANKMSLFFAYPTPMMNTIIEATSKFLNTDASVPKDNVTTALATVANVCQDMVEKKTKFANDHTLIFCLRAMTGSIILYDHLSGSGAFHKKTQIHIKGCIMGLKNTPETSGLLNALKFTTMHLNDPETPANIKALLDS